jgi:SAM-dependent methyltransferase
MWIRHTPAITKGVPMLKYVASAAALKTLSLSPSFYRLLGNTVGAKRRVNIGLRQQYLDRVKNVFATSSRYNVQDGHRLLELGTGWVHWESLIYRLFYDVEVVLFDVWDNRQLTAVKRYCKELDGVIDAHLNLSSAQSERVHRLIRQIIGVNSFDELYQLLNWRYLMQPSGRLINLPSESFNLVYSVNVAEHIQRDIVPGYIRDMFRVLKPGGLSVHTIDLKDHLVQYAPGISLKNYLRYSDRTWKVLFENNLQYFNRIQPPAWFKYFEDAGFELVDDLSEVGDLGRIRVHKQYCDLKEKEINCVVLNLVHRRPHRSS